MVEKGELIGTKKNYVFRYTDKTKTNVVSSVSASGVDLPPGGKCLLEVHTLGGPSGTELVLDEVVNVSEDGNAFTLTSKIIKNTPEIQPGRTCHLRFYEIEENYSERSHTTVEEAYDDVAEVLPDAGIDDGCYVNLESEVIANRMEGSETRKVRFVNKRTGKSTIAETHSDYVKSGRVYFPVGARKDIGASSGDEIGIVDLGEAGESDHGSKPTTDLDEKVNEIHAMVEELYGAYSEAKND